MRFRPGPKTCIWESLGGPQAPKTKRMTGCRVARLVGVIALAAVASSCLPVGNASTDTHSSAISEDGLASDLNPAPPNVGLVATARGATSTSGAEFASVAFDLEDSRVAMADSNLEPSDAVGQTATPTPLATPERVWLVANGEQAAKLAAHGHQVGNTVIVATGDLRALPSQTMKKILDASEVELAPDLSEDTLWQLDVIRGGHQIPGGGLLMFDAGFDRRMVAIYGHPSTSSLGVLGEQGAQAGAERLQSIAQGYDADGAVILPTFEIITTVASASAGSDGDYSAMTARDVIRPWIETATANDMYVVLDLQSGRSDFLSQAKVYEEFLLLPNVGLALDPEWRLKHHEVHLQQIGTVDAAEINQVVEWLAGLVREHALPQKLLIVHQFRYSMITNRAAIETPPELAILIHMDGQGSMRAKYSTWDALTTMDDAHQFHWGWKNFYDEDSPMATPEQVLELTPNSVFVSFQ